MIDRERQIDAESTIGVSVDVIRAVQPAPSVARRTRGRC
jgi:hypothetical protein